MKVSQVRQILSDSREADTDIKSIFTELGLHHVGPSLHIHYEPEGHGISSFDF